MKYWYVFRNRTLEFLGRAYGHNRAQAQREAVRLYGKGVHIGTQSRSDNPGGSKMTKKQRKAKARSGARKRRIAKAAGALLKAVRNPGKKIFGVRVTRLKGGGVSIKPVKKPKGAKR